ncbi:hypothetical protein UFOVP81_18 [uncultured Caudovirales phage]|uniref:Uncharacterized protein n=1 Tax=uncultured Caudovirales phage TaxID=2100421 RepID=A0A6J5KZL4_9CAUD|nr:hypothetical protein UFOVP81_18 [uncultured Caudovirales phage]
MRILMLDIEEIVTSLRVVVAKIEMTNDRIVEDTCQIHERIEDLEKAVLKLTTDIEITTKTVLRLVGFLYSLFIGIISMFGVPILIRYFNL